MTATLNTQMADPIANCRMVYLIDVAGAFLSGDRRNRQNGRFSSIGVADLVMQIRGKALGLRSSPTP